MNIIQKNGKYWKECDIVMLPATNDSGYWFSFAHKRQHLYLLSNEQINEGDWYLNWETNYATEPREKWVLYNCTSKPNGNQPKKIIASTDTNLHYTKCNHCGHLNQMHDWSCNNCHKQGSLYFNMPKLPEDFIKKYVESNGKMDKILVEYEGIESIIEQRINTIHTFEYKIKLNPDNTINILIEESVEEAAEKFAYEYFDDEEKTPIEKMSILEQEAHKLIIKCFIEGAKWQKNQLNN